MNAYLFTFAGLRMAALPSGALWLRESRLLCVSDLHLGKSDRIARRIGVLLPPYETAATLDRLEADIAACDPAEILCLGDSFDDLAAAESLTNAEIARLRTAQAGRRWIWVAGNHDSGPVELGGVNVGEWHAGPLTFRHIARPGAAGEISGHYHPKLSLPGLGAARACFLIDATRVILPAYGAYTGGLRATDPVVRRLFATRALAVLTGARCLPVPLPEARPDREAPQTRRRGWTG